MSEGIWSYFKKYNLGISSENQLTLGEGNTPLEEINILGQKFLVKREDLNPSRSFKDRSLAFQLSFYLQNSFHEFVLSSSGNAGISLISFAIKYPQIEVHVFFSKTLSNNKLENLNSILSSKILSEEINSTDETYIYSNGNINIYFSKKPKIHSLIFSNSTNIKHLRPSHDDMALVGYRTLGEEISNIPFDDLYLLSSSGNAFLGVQQGIKSSNIEKNYCVNIIQTPEIHPISQMLTNIQVLNLEVSEVNCVVDRVANRKKDILNSTKNQKVIGHIVYNNDIIILREILGKMKHKYANYPSNTLAPLAIAYKDYECKFIKDKMPLVIFSGI